MKKGIVFLKNDKWHISVNGDISCLLIGTEKLYKSFHQNTMWNVQMTKGKYQLISEA